MTAPESPGSTLPSVDVEGLREMLAKATIKGLVSRGLCFDDASGRKLYGAVHFEGDRSLQELRDVLALIVAAVNALPALLDRLATAERERDEARADRDSHQRAAIRAELALGEKGEG